MHKRMLLSMALSGFLSAGLAQTSEPPVKMGLWQSKVTSTMTGFQIPPDVAARLKAMGRPVPGSDPQITVSQSCLTPEKWKDMFSHMQRNHDCQFTNEHRSSTGMSADMACKSTDGHYTSTGRVDMNFTSSNKMTGKVHVETTRQSQPQPIVMDMIFDRVYQGADCHGISPDSPKIIN
jgi:acyl-coenzyme A synthetase/AMP-(fatty) acid ligase